MPTPRLTLSIPKSEAKNQLNSQIEQGNMLINRISETLESEAGLAPSLPEDLWLEKSRYTNGNIAMLSHMFRDQSVANGFEKFNSRIFYTNDPVNPRRDLQHIKDLAIEEVNELRSILEGLRFVRKRFVRAMRERITRLFSYRKMKRALDIAAPIAAIVFGVAGVAGVVHTLYGWHRLFDWLAKTFFRH